MGFAKLTAVVDKLNEKGLRAQRGYPAQRMPDPITTVAAVNVECITPEQTRVVVQIFSPTSGPTCEAGAQIAMTALGELGAIYEVGGCGYDSKMGLYTCRVTGAWKTSSNCTVQVAGINQPYVVGVAVKRAVSRTRVADPETGQMVEECRDMGWNITIEEILPANALPEADVQEEFTLRVFRPTGHESYQKCRWAQISIQSVANGLRRLRIARTWEERTVTQ